MTYTATFDKIDLQRLTALTAQLPQIFPRKLVIGLVGTLGAGKTTLTQQIASSMGIDPTDVTSPTFTLLSSYDIDRPRGPSRLHHLDAYRVHDEDEFLELGIDELLDCDDSWVVIEWADRVRAVMPHDTLWIAIESGGAMESGADTRRITMQTEATELSNGLKQLSSAMNQQPPFSDS